MIKALKTVIGVCGSRLSGKDTVASLIEKNTDIVTVSLADPIKVNYANMMNISLQALYTQGPLKEKHRIGLITLGAVRRSDNIDWWCKELHKAHQQQSVVIPDIRFRNELDYFRQNSENFILCSIECSDKNKKERGWLPSIADNTTSETERLAFKSNADFIIDNNNSLIELQKNVKKVINTLDIVSLYV